MDLPGAATLPQGEAMNDLVAKSIISKSRDKALAPTKTWTSNLLIKVAFAFKHQLPEGRKNLKEIVGYLKGKNYELMNVTKKLEDVEEIRVEDSGYITFVNLEKDTEIPATNQAKKPQQKPQKNSKEEEKKEELKNLTL